MYSTCTVCGHIHVQCTCTCTLILFLSTFPISTHSSLDFTLLVVFLFSLIPSLQVKRCYVDFLLHCYIDAEVDNKETFTKEFMWDFFSNVVDDIRSVCDGNDDNELVKYVTLNIPECLNTYFGSKLGITSVKVNCTHVYSVYMYTVEHRVAFCQSFTIMYTV